MTTTSGEPTPGPVAGDSPPPARPAVWQEWSGPLRRVGLPLGVSVLIHILLLLATATVVWNIAGRAAGPEVAVSFTDPGRAGTPTQAAAAGAIQPVEASAGLAKLGPSSPARADAGSAGPAPALAGLASQAAGTGSAPRLETAPDPSDTAGLVRGPGPTGADVRFAGLGASSARSVVYVVDGSGPMVSTIRDVMAEVQRSIGRLGAAQRFGIVIFRRIDAAPTAGDADGFEWFTPALVRATPEAKQRMQDWVARVRPRGRSNPLDGLRAAIGMKPDAIFLLSRSIERSGGGVWDLGLKPTMAELDRLNPVDPSTGRRPIVIKTIQFVDEDPTGIMQAIGKQHGGARPDAEASAYTVIRRGADLLTKEPGAPK